jgi:kynurenine formamidase/dienelactone hydrolase
MEASYSSVPNLFQPHISRVLYFGVSWADVLRVGVTARDWNDWSLGLERLGDELAKNAEDAASEGRQVTAAGIAMHAAAYFHYAQFKLFPEDPSKSRLQAKLRNSYRTAAPHLSPPALRWSVPFGGTVLAGYLRMRHPNAPLVILLNGLDSTKEVELHKFGEIFIHRGMNILMLDGPGQGENLRSISLISNFELAISEVIDALAEHSPAAIGIFGVSFGGHLAVRSAALDRRIKACVSLSGFYDASIFGFLPESAVAALRHACHLKANETVEDVGKYFSLEPLRNRMDRPLLIVHGSADNLIASAQIEAMRDWASGFGRVMLLQGAEHVCTSKFVTLLPEIGDWMRSHLGDGPCVNEREHERGVMVLDERQDSGPGQSSPMLVDLSVCLDRNQSERVPVVIRRVDHLEGAGHMCDVFDISRDLLPHGLGWASEVLTASTHAGTHMDAPWHYGPMCREQPSRTIDQIPLQWCYGPGVVLHLEHKEDGTEITPGDLKEALAKIQYELCPGDITFVYTGASRYWGSPDYLRKGAGFGRDGILWLTTRGVRVIGTDAWGIDRPFEYMRNEYHRTRDPAVVWPAHFAGRDTEYCQLEKLSNLDKLPAVGFTVACFPIQVAQASAGWVRAVAIINAKQSNPSGASAMRL